jgi:hypothetical protein
MKKIFFTFIIFYFAYTGSFAQNASTYFPLSTGYKWYYENIPLDSNNIPQLNLTSYRIDSFAVVESYNGLMANKVFLKDYLLSFFQNTPYNDTNYYNFQTTNAWKYLKTILPNSIPLPGILNFFKSLENWYSTFRFTQTIGSAYTILQKDTTIAIDTLTIPLRAKVTGTRLNDEVVSTVYGNITAKKFVFLYGLYYRILIFTFPIIERPDTTWIAQNLWMVKEITPTVRIDLTSIGIPVNIPFPGNIYQLSLPPTGIRNISTEVPSGFSLSQNYPNPFNPVTKIKFDITTSLSFPNALIGNPFVSLKVYDALGREVATLVNGSLQPGKYEVTFDGTKLSSGIYFYRIEATGIGNNYLMTKMMTLIK